MSEHERPVTAVPAAELKTRAAAVAEELRARPDAAPASTSMDGGSLHRGLPPALQQRFIAIRTALFERGIYDPVLVRFDTATAPQAGTREIADQLAAVAESL